MKRYCIVLLAFCLFFNVSALSSDVTIENISYSLDLSSRTASVTGSTLVHVVVPETVINEGVTYEVTSIAKRAFYQNTTIKSIKTGNKMKTIITGNYSYFYRYISGDEWSQGAFDGATNLEEADFGENLEEIGGGAFYGATSLRRIKVGTKLMKIGDSAFKNCINLKYIVLPQTINSVVYNEVPYNQYDTFYGSDQLSIICLKNGFSTGYTNQTIYPSSFFSFSNSTTVYNGKVPEVYYTFNGIGCGFLPTAVNTETMEATAGNHTSNLTFTIANDDMSFDVDIPYEYTINPVTLTAKVSDVSRLYGDANPQFSSTYSGFVNNEDASELTSQGSYTTTATAKSDVGTYSIKQTGATAQNYVFEYEEGTLTINKAPLTMIANDKTMTYGGTIPTLDAKYEGLKNNEAQPVWNTEPKYSTTATSASKVGTYPITISDADAKNYQLTVNGGTMTVEKAELTVKVDDKSRIYGDANPEFTLTYTGLKNGETVPEWEKLPTVETTADVNSNVGTYPISVKDAVAVNYNITAKGGTLTINKAALQITPKDATRKYGEDNPKFELSYVGLKNNENVPEWTVNPVITTNATKTSSVGEYAIQVKTAEARNYTLEKNVGTLTVTKAPLVVAINNYSRKYGEANPNFEFHYSGLLNGETTPLWTTMPIITTEANSMSDVGEYEIKGTGGEMKNYEATEILSGQLTITPASLTIKANDVSRIYYEENPELTFNCIGLIGNDDASVLTAMPQIKTSATKLSKVGVYAIEIDGASSKNYTIGYENGQLTINPRQLIVSTKDYTRTYGEENPQFELNYSGFVNNEDENVLLSKPKAMTEAKPDTDVGVYDITIGYGVAENYEFSYIGGKLTIEKAYQTLTWDQDFNDVKQYDQIELTATASSGLEIAYTVEGDPIGSIIKIGKKQYLECTGVGEALIVAIQSGNKNYWQSTKIYKPIVVGSANVNDYDVEVVNSDGVTIYYNYINNGKELEVAGIEKGATNADILSSVTINGRDYQVTSIGKRAFEGRDDIEYLSIPWSVKSIGEFAFIDCGSNMTVNIADPESWCQMELGNEHSSPLACAKKVLVFDIETDNITIPEGVTFIGNYTFYQCRCIKSLTIPSTVTFIGSSAFEGCTGLTSLTLNDGLESVGGSAFEGCTGLQTLTIPSTVNTVSIDAFAGCKGITDVYCLAEDVPNTDENAFDGTPTEKSTLHVPAKAVEAYRAAWPWSDFKEIVALTDVGIMNVKQSDNDNGEYFDLYGRKVYQPRKGLNIFHRHDGKIVKIMVK